MITRQWWLSSVSSSSMRMMSHGSVAVIGRQILVGRRRRLFVMRGLAVYAVGEGWTGALGTGRLDQYVPGHFDDDDYDDDIEQPPNSTTNSTAESSASQQQQQQQQQPQLQQLQPMYEGPVQAVAVGWGHSAVLTNQHEIWVTGRPHDFSALLRLQRLPSWIREYSVRQALKSIHTNNSSMDNNDETTVSSAEASTTQQQQKQQQPLTYAVWNPTELVAGLVTWLSNWASPDSLDWEVARQQSILPQLTPLVVMKKKQQQPHQDDTNNKTVVNGANNTTSNHHDNNKPGDEYPIALACSAGFSAFITHPHGHLYTFGLNGYGQCGIGVTTNNVWQPTRVTGLNAAFCETGARSDMPQAHPITQVALGLQHGVCLDSTGQLFCWGKGERGQLGQETVLLESHTALPVKKTVSLETIYSSAGSLSSSSGPVGKPIYQPIGKVVQIAAGLLHSAALTEDNRVLMWGKHVLPVMGEDMGKKPASDAHLPVVLSSGGWNHDVPVLQVACGSHHTSMLLQDGSVWAVGISSDTKEPMHEPTMLIPPGIVEMPIRQFAAHMDRTTVVGQSGRQVLQVSLWYDPALQEYGAYMPTWLDRILQADESMRIREVHRGWMHSVVVTD